MEEEIKSCSYINVQLDGAADIVPLRFVGAAIGPLLFLFADAFYVRFVAAAAVISLKMTKWNEHEQPSANIIQARVYANVMVFMSPEGVTQMRWNIKSNWIVESRMSSGFCKKDKKKRIDKNFPPCSFSTRDGMHEMCIFMPRRPIGSKTSRRSFCQAASNDIERERTTSTACDKAFPVYSSSTRLRFCCHCTQSNISSDVELSLGVIIIISHIAIVMGERERDEEMSAWLW